MNSSLADFSRSTAIVNSVISDIEAKLNAFRINPQSDFARGLICGAVTIAFLADFINDEQHSAYFSSISKINLS